MVEANDVIMIIESMKMEIPVEAPCAGKIAEIRTAEGESIFEMAGCLGQVAHGTGKKAKRSVDR